jgi:hypothetical protein
MRGGGYIVPPALAAMFCTISLPMKAALSIETPSQTMFCQSNIRVNCNHAKLSIATRDT